MRRAVYERVEKAEKRKKVGVKHEWRDTGLGLFIKR
jgi:hypothetical protein